MTPEAERPPGSLYDLAASDPDAELVDASELSPDDIAQVDAIMAAMGRLREVEQRLATAARHRMALNDTDLRALHFLIVAANRRQTVTARALAEHLGITTASTTKMLDRLERAGHVTRHPHSHDRRALAISVAPASRRRAIDIVGRQQASRFGPAAALTAAERDAVRRFLITTADALEASFVDQDPSTT
ncbi:MarR family winged helix-turn-helix transcriptional regulator [Microlunatus soli]|uniref:DNA-binding transcriptional regulator, MarR family n=1 Tax=Microlunatus soli TaxID=630515 RepID=A0A1H1YX14_9ACTN|nr:MarR family winged helix-turn-helix transcriptional regulator [Microlunatus soli]SDT25980.1 DNA-binding transcriptional regulator, MarR family [Microlunatus soli]